MFDPTTLPSAKPGASPSTAWIDTNNSGADVPKATTVRLTTKAEMPNRNARLTAPRTNASPARTRITKPKIAKAICAVIQVCPRLSDLVLADHALGDLGESAACAI